jgi:hypothetical protein
MVLNVLGPIVTALPTKVTVFNDDTVTPGLMGSGVVLLLAIAVFFLLRSFRKHVDRVPPTFDEPDSDDRVEH